MVHLKGARGIRQSEYKATRKFIWCACYKSVCKTKIRNRSIWKYKYKFNEDKYSSCATYFFNDANHYASCKWRDCRNIMDWWRKVFDGTLQVGAILAFINYLNIILMSLMSISMVFIQIARAFPSADRVQQVLNTEVDIISEANAIEPEKIEGNIEFKMLVIAIRKIMNTF